MTRGLLPPPDASGFVPYLRSDRVVRLGESAVAGLAKITPDRGWLDTVLVGDPLPPGAPLTVWIHHFPGKPDRARLDAAVERATDLYRATPGGSGLPLVGCRTTVVPESFAVRVEVSLEERWWPLAFHLVASVEAELMALGLPPRRISHLLRRPVDTIMPSAAKPGPSGRLPLPASARLAADPCRDDRAAKRTHTSLTAAPEAPPSFYSDSGTAVESPNHPFLPAAIRRKSTHGRGPWRKLLSFLSPRRPRVDTLKSARRPLHTAGSGRAELRVARTGGANATRRAFDLSATIARCALRHASMPPPRARFSVRTEDLRFQQLGARPETDRCLLIDTSGSMSGPRGRTCAVMADYLLRNGRGRMAIVAFQDERAEVKTGFTRSRHRLLKAVADTRPHGRTPLADGLLQSLRLIAASHARTPQVILITDGVPTKSLWSANSAADALRAAEMCRAAGVKLISVGLRANEPFLRELTVHSDGRLFVVSDLSPASLIAVSRRALAGPSKSVRSRPFTTNRPS